MAPRNLEFEQALASDTSAGATSPGEARAH